MFLFASTVLTRSNNLKISRDNFRIFHSAAHIILRDTFHSILRAKCC